MRHFKIGIDLDDVLVDFMSEFTKICNRLFGKPELGTLPVDWDWSNFYLTKAEKATAWEELSNIENFWANLPVEEGADPDIVERLSDDHELFFITARVPSRGWSTEHQSKHWVHCKMDVIFPTVIVSSNKGPIAAALKFDYFIDDRPKNCIDIHEALPDCKVYLKDSSHNQSFVCPEWLTRVRDFNQFAKIVDDAAWGK